jgi:IclR family acetate operon transcriptional repressor
MRNASSRPIASLRKGIDLLFLFPQAEPVLSLGEIATRLSVPKSTAHRFTSTLRDAGVLVQDPVSRRYRLSSRLLALQSAIARPADLRAVALPHLHALTERSGETAHLADRRGSLAVISEVVESPHLLRMVPKRGQAIPLHAGALARAILAYLPPREIEAILRGRLPRLTPHTPITAAAVRRLILATQKTGYAVSFQEITVGGYGIAAPIRDARGAVIASLGVSGPVQRLTPERREVIVRYLLIATRELSDIMRHSRGPEASAQETASGPAALR